MKFATIPLFFLISFCTFSQESFSLNSEFFNSKSLSTLTSTSLIGTSELKKEPEFKLTESCLKNDFGSILQVENIGDLSSETINYFWYYNGEIINLEIKSSLIVKKPGIYAVDINIGEDINRRLEIQIGLTLPTSFELCRNDTLLIKPFGNESKIIKWLLPNNASVTNVDSIIIPNATNQNNGIYKLQSESLSGCSYQSQTQVLVKDYVAFDIPSIIEFAEGDLFSITPSYPALTDSTETPQTLDFSNSESTIWGNIRLLSYGEYFQIYSRKNLNDDFSHAKTTFADNYTITGKSNLGCSTEKSFAIKVAKNEIKASAELGNPLSGRVCVGVKNTIPIINKKNIPENAEFEVIMYTPDMKKSLKGKVERDTAIFDFIPPSFYQKLIHFELKLIDSLKPLFVSKTYGLGENYKRILGAELYCDSVKFYSTNIESKWFYGDNLINGANGSSYFASKKGTYFALLENGSFSRTGCAYIYSQGIKADDYLGKINELFLHNDPLEYCLENKSTLTTNYKPSAGSTISWKRDEITLSSENKSSIEMENEGIYRAEVSIGSCKASSQPFENKKNSIIKAELNVVSPYYSEYIAYTRPESLELCQGTTFALEIRIAKKKNIFSNLNWYRNGTKLDNRNNTEELFNTEGEYTIFGKFGQCAVVSNDIKVTYKDTIHTKLRNSGMEYVDLSNRADIYFSTAKINSGELVKTTFDYSWYKDGSVYHDQMERSYNSGDGYIYSYIQPSQEGLYYAIGEIGMGNGANCIVSSDSILLHSLDLIDSSKFAFVSDTIEYRLCDNSPFVLHTNNSRALVYEWFKDGNKLDIKSDSLQVRTTGFYEVHVTIKNGGVYNYPFVVEMNFTPNIVFNNSFSSSQQLASNVLDNCNKDENVVLIENYTSFSEVSYQWFFNGDEINFKDYPNLIVREAGAYQVKLLENNCEVLSNILNLESDEKEEINFGNELQYLCNEETLSIKPENDSTSTFLWLMDGELLSTIATNNIKVQEEATYIPIAKNRFCIVEYKPLKVSQLYLPNELNHAGDTIFCPSEKVELKGIPQVGLEYRFTKDGETLISSLKPQYSVTESGTYKLYYEKGNCSVPSIPLLIKKEFETELYAESNFLCSGENITLYLFNGENLSYEWYRDTTTLENVSPSMSISQSGSYYGIISSEKCIANSDTLVIKESKPSIAVINGISTINYGDSTFINLEITGNANPWQITLSDGTELSIDKSPYQHSVSPKETTTFTITSLTDECGEGIFDGFATVTLIILGTEINELENISVYPNPSESFLFIDYNTEENPIPTMTSMEGKAVPISYEYSNAKMRIDLRKLQAGTYLLSLEKNGARTVKKIVKY